MKFKKTLSLVFSLSFATSTFAQIAVTVTTDIPATINQIETIAKWTAQFQQLTTQIDQMKAQYAALTGGRGLGQILNDPELHKYLPDEWAGIYEKVKSGQLTGISNYAQSIVAAEGFDPNVTGGAKRQQDVLVYNKAITLQAYAQTQVRLNNINALMQQADATQDAKAAADLQNRMAAENAMIQNEQIRLNLAAQLQQTEIQLANKQQSREFYSNFFKRSN